MRVAFIWHMHQPFYKDLKTGEYLMPWVRLHACKDYLDMLLILDEFPRIKQTFNLVPSLLEQIVDYTDNGALDRHLFLSHKSPDDLSDEERKEIAESFFAANYPTMIKPYLRYNELYHKCGEKSDSTVVHALTDQDIIDLQVWFNATWIDPTLRNDRKIKAIFKKGRDFTIEERNVVLDFQIDLMKKIIPAYQERHNSGKIEVSFSPFYHPILPLLIDTDSARMSLPNIVLPSRRFLHPEDAEVHVARSAEMYHSLFGPGNFGMWPSEGSVSEAILPILKRQGVRWIASDEEIYFASLNNPQAKKRDAVGGAAGIHQPYWVGESESRLGMLFRDHRLSDKIGFVYSTWDADKAATDFVNELHALEGKYKGVAANPLVSIILDGENAWEYYPNDGIDFLRALYKLVDKDPTIETVLPSDVFEKDKEITSLPFLFSGSWIDHNFRVWIGHEEDNLAWDLLNTTREQLMDFLNNNPGFDKAQADLAWKEIYIAEGSDWCWWYGDDHHTDFFEMFDYLFRKHLQNIWEIIGKEPPLSLMQPIRKQSRQIGLLEPTDFVSPIIDGKQTDYFEWIGAGKIDCHRMGGAMHRTDAKILQIFYGYDDDYLYFRIDFEKEIPVACETANVQIELAGDERLLISASHKTVTLHRLVDQTTQVIEREIKFACDKIVEMAVPRDVLTTEASSRLFFSVAMRENEKIVERWPEVNYISLQLPKRGETFFWRV